MLQSSVAGMLGHLPHGSHAGDETWALIFPEDAEVGGVLADLVGRDPIGDGKRSFLVRGDVVVVLQQVDIGPL